MKIASATLRVMHSKDYNHFETSLTIMAEDENIGITEQEMLEARLTIEQSCTTMERNHSRQLEWDAERDELDARRDEVETFLPTQPIEQWSDQQIGLKAVYDAATEILSKDIEGPVMAIYEARFAEIKAQLEQMRTEAKNG